MLPALAPSRLLHPLAFWPPAILAALLITFCAFLFRIHNLAYESLDIDEADVVFFALQDLPALLGRITQPGGNGPLYIILLRLWTGAAGQSEFSLRYFSLLPAVLSVPLLFVLGKRLLGVKVGLLSALLLTVSSYQLYYAQMSKMYALVLLLSLLAGYLLLHGLRRPDWRTWTGYTVVTTAAMYTHIFGALLVPWHALFVLLNLRGHRGALAPWLLSLAVLALPYLPIGLLRLSALRAPESLDRQLTGPQDPFGMLATLAREYGTRFDLLPGPFLAGLFLTLTLGGLYALYTSRTADNGGLARWFIGLGLTVPLSLTSMFVALGAPVFATRYLILTLPVFYLLWAGGLAGLARWSRGVGLAVLVGFVLLNGARWSETAFQEQRFREDWRGAVAHLEQRYAPGDQVVVLHDNAAHAVEYYASRTLRLASLDGGPERPPDLRKAPSRPASGRLWLLAAYFEVVDLPPVERWLEERGALADKTWLAGVMVSQYRLD